MSDDAAISMSRRALTQWLKENPFDSAGVGPRRGDGFYVDAVGQVRACRTDARIERPSRDVLRRWGVCLNNLFLRAVTNDAPEEVVLGLQALRDEIEAWDAPDPRAALARLQEATAALQAAEARAQDSA